MNPENWETRRAAVAGWCDKRAEAFAAATADLDKAEAYARFLASVPAGGRILDAGCGAGRDSAHFLERGYAVTAFDLSPEMARLARERTGLEVGVRDLTRAQWRPEFHGVWAMASLLHLPRAAAGPAAANLGRALLPGGVLLVSGKHGNREWEKDGTWFSALDEAWLDDFLARNPGLRRRESWRRPDDRPGREREEWFTFILERAAG
ncbi:MAG: class I SAM-dependent methyltransferase [Thermodesulfobacteriota bacterium]